MHGEGCQLNKQKNRAWERASVRVPTLRPASPAPPFHPFTAFARPAHCSAIIVPMMQWSHLVVSTCSSSWIIQRVVATDWAKQQKACAQRGGGAAQGVQRPGRQGRAARSGGQRQRARLDERACGHWEWTAVRTKHAASGRPGRGTGVV